MPHMHAAGLNIYSPSNSDRQHNSRQPKQDRATATTVQIKYNKKHAEPTHRCAHKYHHQPDSKPASPRTNENGNPHSSPLSDVLQNNSRKLPSFRHSPRSGARCRKKLSHVIRYLWQASNLQVYSCDRVEKGSKEGSGHSRRI